MNKQLQKDLEKELIESFKVLYSSLYQHKSFEQFKNDVEIYLNEIKHLMSISDDVDLKVKFVCVLPKGVVKHTNYQQIQQFVKNGVELDENVERFSMHVRAEFRKNNVKYQSTDEQPFFKSETFVLKDNVQSQMSKAYVAAAQDKNSKVVMLDSESLQEFSNNRIRFGAEKKVEL